MNRQDHKKEKNARDRLLEAAIDIFGRDGFDAATTRSITGKAGVNIAAIPYYFESKEGLYRAVVTHIVETIKTQVADITLTATPLLFTGNSGKQKAFNTLLNLIEKIIMFAVGSEEGRRFSRIIFREQMYPTGSYEIIYKGYMEPILNAVATLITVITENPCQRTAQLRAMTIIGQVLIFRVARETIVRSLDMEGYNPSETKEISRIILEHTRKTLTNLTDQ
ncbi:CerR family C-terminal domain-containing protein [Desulfomarina sp.]